MLEKVKELEKRILNLENDIIELSSSEQVFSEAGKNIDVKTFSRPEYRLTASSKVCSTMSLNTQEKESDPIYLNYTKLSFINTKEPQLPLQQPILQDLGASKFSSTGLTRLLKPTPLRKTRALPSLS
ncbi:hypothetical protein PUN28_020797 [Cardiocondyla obscurior]|uniref:Uncharacterized protein n=1 Tax=Cardiocondyla obscurior TaxID=286306 RepID=A0AAW2E6F0_9HYME